MSWEAVILATFGIVNTTLLTGIFFRLGKNSEQIIDVVRRVEALEQDFVALFDRVIDWIGNSK